jgi:hypothetical protein
VRADDRRHFFAVGIGADRHRLAWRVSRFHLPVAMIRGCIAIPDVDPKTWRSRGRNRKQPALASAIVTPAPMKKRRLSGTVTRRRTARSSRDGLRSSSRPRNTMLAHLVDDYDPEAHRRAGEKADELFREIVRRAARKE